MRISVRKRKKKKKCRLYQTPINCLPRDVLYNWAQGLGSGPDVPHTDNVLSARKTEGSGVGVTKEPPVSVRDLDLGKSSAMMIPGLSGGDAYNLCFTIRLIGQEVTWETLLVRQTLYVEIPNDILPEGSKESFVSLLEYAEEVLHCSNVIVCFKKNRSDRASLIRTFMFLGFALVAPGSHRLAVSSDLMYLAYAIEPTSSDSDSDLSD